MAKKTNDLHFRASSANAIQESELADVLIVRINTDIESSNKPRLINYLKTKIDMWFFFKLKCLIFFFKL